MVVELGEVASATRFNLFGPALYSLDAQDSFGDDVKVQNLWLQPASWLLLLSSGWRPHSICWPYNALLQPTSALPPPLP